MEAPDVAAAELRESEIVLLDGERAVIRRVRDDGASALPALVDRCSDDSVCSRCFGSRRSPTSRDRELVTDIDGHHQFAFVVEIDAVVVALGSCFTSANGGPPEVSLFVQDDHQGQGIGTLLFKRLASTAVLEGHDQLRAQVLGTNRRMLRLFAHSGLVIDRHLDGGVLDLTIHLGGNEYR